MMSGNGSAFGTSSRKIMYCAHIPFMIVLAILHISSFCVCGMLQWDRLVCVMLLGFALVAFFVTGVPFWSVSLRQIKVVCGEASLSKRAIGLLRWGIPNMVASVVDVFVIVIAVVVALKVLGIGDEFFADRLTVPSGVRVEIPIDDDSWMDNNESDDRSVVRNASLEIMRSPMGYRAAVNPGEPGKIYLKAYELSSKRRLSADDIMKSTTTTAKFSSNPEEKFIHKGEFRIHEGDIDHPYAACFELCFVPLSGGPERKIVESTYLVTGSYHSKPFDSFW